MDKSTLKQQYEKEPEEEGGHWIWRSNSTKVRYGGKTYYPHRLIWELVNKRPIPQGKALKRGCGIWDCVNPTHMRQVDRDEPIKATRWKKGVI